MSKKLKAKTIDLLERVIWTGVQAGASYAAVQVAGWDDEWVPALTIVLSLVKNLAGRKVGDPNSGAIVPDE